MNKVSVMKGLRLAEIAYENRLPSVSLIQSASIKIIFPCSYSINNLGRSRFTATGQSVPSGRS